MANETRCEHCGTMLSGIVETDGRFHTDNRCRDLVRGQRDEAIAIALRLADWDAPTYGEDRAALEKLRGK